MNDTTLPLRLLLTREQIEDITTALDLMYYDRDDEIRALCQCRRAGALIDEAQLWRLTQERLTALQLRVNLYNQMDRELNADYSQERKKLWSDGDGA